MFDQSRLTRITWRFNLWQRFISDAEMRLGHFRVKSNPRSGSTAEQSDRSCLIFHDNSIFEYHYLLDDKLFDPVSIVSLQDMALSRCVDEWLR